MKLHRLRNTEPPVQAAAARLEQHFVQVPAPGPDQQPVKAAVLRPEMRQVHVVAFDNPGTKSNYAISMGRKLQ